MRPEVREEVRQARRDFAIAAVALAALLALLAYVLTS